MNDASPAPFDLNSASPEALTAQFPDLGLFSAEDIVEWREKNGPLREKKTLTDLGIREELAARIAEYIVPVAPSVPATDAGSMNPGDGTRETMIVAAHEIEQSSSTRPADEPARSAPSTPAVEPVAADSSEPTTTSLATPAEHDSTDSTDSSRAGAAPRMPVLPPAAVETAVAKEEEPVVVTKKEEPAVVAKEEEPAVVAKEEPAAVAAAD
ncbi:MAG TPA: helix-hairpin-helix domain-containing protein, partial [Labilithrix sp.]|nr:helix-hairpin-helix domain-containing protein [Labilithrix sp.]